MLTQSEILTVMRNAIYVVLVGSAPMLIAALLIGLIVSIFQATTQINEQTLAFVPKIIGIFASFSALYHLEGHRFYEPPLPVHRVDAGVARHGS